MTEKIKVKNQQNITKAERDEKINNMFDKASKIVGIAPITKKHIKLVCEQLTQKGILKRSETIDIRLQRTVKSLVKAWTIKNLLLTEEDWNKIGIKEIKQMNRDDSDIIFIECETREDVSLITSHAKSSKTQTALMILD